MKIIGPYITVTMIVPAHEEEVLDVDAYWHLDYEGRTDGEGGFLYAKVAFPKVADAQRAHHDLDIVRQAARQSSNGRRRKR